jgi:hypothetical protein
MKKLLQLENFINMVQPMMMIMTQEAIYQGHQLQVPVQEALFRRTNQQLHLSSQHLQKSQL